MLISHDLDDGVLRLVPMCDLDVSARAAATLQAEALLYAYRLRHVELPLPTAAPSSASLGALARTRRLCDALGISLTRPFQPTADDSAPHTSGGRDPRLPAALRTQARPGMDRPDPGPFRLDRVPDSGPSPRPTPPASGAATSHHPETVVALFSEPARTVSVGALERAGTVNGWPLAAAADPVLLTAS